MWYIKVLTRNDYTRRASESSFRTKNFCILKLVLSLQHNQSSSGENHVFKRPSVFTRLRDMGKRDIAVF